MPYISPPTKSLIAFKYETGRKIGEGSFGIIHEGINISNHKPVAIKFEPRRSDAPQLKDEYHNYKLLKGSAGIPTAHYFGQEGNNNVLVMDLLGPSLEEQFDACDRKFSIKTVCMLAIKMIRLVEEVHKHNLIYRDIKPDNFLMGQPDSPDFNNVFLVDFGMAKVYRHKDTHQHIPYKEGKSLSGTARYMSINTHLGREQSRRDDLESLGHVFMYFLRGSLPWQGLKATSNKQKYEKIGQTKQSTRINILCGEFPQQFSDYMTYTRNMAFTENPNYDLLCNLFKSVLKDLGETEDDKYDWVTSDQYSSTTGKTIIAKEKCSSKILVSNTPLDQQQPTTNRQRYSRIPCKVKKISWSKLKYLLSCGIF